MKELSSSLSIAMSTSSASTIQILFNLATDTEVFKQKMTWLTLQNSPVKTHGSHISLSMLILYDFLTYPTRTTPSMTGKKSNVSTFVFRPITTVPAVLPKMKWKPLYYTKLVSWYIYTKPPHIPTIEGKSEVSRTRIQVTRTIESLEPTVIYSSTLPITGR